MKILQCRNPWKTSKVLEQSSRRGHVIGPLLALRSLTHCWTWACDIHHNDSCYWFDTSGVMHQAEAFYTHVLRQEREKLRRQWNKPEESLSWSLCVYISLTTPPAPNVSTTGFLFQTDGVQSPHAWPPLQSGLLDKLHLFLALSSGGVLCVAASIGWCRTQNNSLS